MTTDRPMGCSADSQCAPGSRCQRTGGEHQSGLCCLSGPACPPTFLLDVELSRKPCSPLQAPTCADGQAVCLFSDVLERFVCCRRSLKPARELRDCPGKMLRDPRNRTCSQSELCPPSFNCIRRNFDRVGICCRHQRTPLVVSYSRECGVLSGAQRRVLSAMPEQRPALP